MMQKRIEDLVPHQDRVRITDTYTFHNSEHLVDNTGRRKRIAAAVLSVEPDNNGLWVVRTVSGTFKAHPGEMVDVHEGDDDLLKDDGIGFSSRERSLTVKGISIE